MPESLLCIKREELRAEIEKNGHKGYDAHRDTQLVRKLIAARQQLALPAEEAPF